MIQVNEAYEISEDYSLGNLLCWSVLWLGQLQDLGYIVKMMDGVKRGGELVSVIAPFAYCANPYLQQTATNMIKVVSNAKHWLGFNKFLQFIDLLKCFRLLDH